MKEIFDLTDAELIELRQDMIGEVGYYSNAEGSSYLSETAQRNTVYGCMEFIEAECERRGYQLSFYWKTYRPKESMIGEVTIRGNFHFANIYIDYANPGHIGEYVFNRGGIAIDMNFPIAPGWFKSLADTLAWAETELRNYDQTPQTTLS